jgi:hypothetical protein
LEKSSVIRRRPKTNAWRPFFNGELFVPTISYRLHYGQSQTPVIEIIPDPGLYRIAWPDIGLSDLAGHQQGAAAAMSESGDPQLPPPSLGG